MSDRLPLEQRLRIQLRHKHSIERFGYRAEALFWKDKTVQTKRFELLAKLLPFPTQTPNQPWTLLDVGCGFADFYSYLNQLGYECDYTGLDISEDMIYSASCLHPDIRLIQGELSDCDFKDNQFDYVVLSGALNEVVDKTGDYAKSTIKNMYRIAGTSVGFNLLNRQDPFTQSRADLQSFYPKDIVVFCEKFAKKVVCHQDYLANDFTVFMYK